MLKETKHDYQNCLTGNFYDSNCTGIYQSWTDFTNTHLGFSEQGKFDDTYHFVFRYDIYNQKDENYCLELCMMLQRKGIYTHLYIHNISKEELNNEVQLWLKERSKYLKNLWEEVINI